MKKVSNTSEQCHVRRTLDVIGGKWKLIILWHLKDTTLRFSELEKAIPDISQKMLAQSLKELEADKIVKRKVYPTIPPKVEYSITQYGHSLDKALQSLDQWGQKHLS